MALNYTHTSGHNLISGGKSKFSWDGTSNSATIDILRCGTTTISGLTVTRPSSTSTTWSGTYGNKTVTITGFSYTAGTTVSGTISRNCGGVSDPSGDCGDVTTDDVGIFSGTKN